MFFTSNHRLLVNYFELNPGVQGTSDVEESVPTPTRGAGEDVDDATVYSPWQDLDLLSFMWKNSAMYKGTSPVLLQVLIFS